MIQWLAQHLLVLLLDESVFLNESLVWFKDKYILTAPFHNYCTTCNYQSLFELSNYFQKVIYSILIATSTHQCLYLNYTLNLNVCNTDMMILCGWKDCEAVSFIYMTAALYRSAAAWTLGQTKSDENVVIAHVKGWGMKQTNHCNLKKESRCCLNRVRDR